MSDRPTDRAYSRANWSLVESLYRQCIEIVKDPEEANSPPEALTGFLAQSLGRVFSYYDSEMEFADDTHALFASVDFNVAPNKDTFQSLYRDQRWNRIEPYSPARQRPRPKPFEAVVETCRRIRDVNEVGRSLARLPTSAILGGSASYGRFFNVRGGTPKKGGSDIDLLLVLGDYRGLAEVPAALSNVSGLSAASLQLLEERIGAFERLRAGELPDPGKLIFSHKIEFWSDVADPCLLPYEVSPAYQLSIHVFSADDLRYLVLHNRPALTSDRDFDRVIWDYRNTEPTRKDNQRNFSGRDFLVDRGYFEVEKGYLSESRVCHISDGRYFPGLYQNIILPQFEVRWEHGPLKPIYLLLAGFRWKIIERLRQERTARPYEYLRLSLSHTRSEVFAPHISRRVDGDR